MADTGRRQQPGFACEECRRRKARCDRVRPKCGHCMETGMTCVILAKKSQRGPKKGQLTALRSQIASLQRQLNQQTGDESQPVGEPDSSPETSGQTTPERHQEEEQATRTIDTDAAAGGPELNVLHETDVAPGGVWLSPSALDVSPAITLNPEWMDWAPGWSPELNPNLGFGMVVGGQDFQSLPPDMEFKDSRSLPPTEPLIVADINDTNTGMTDHMRADLDQVFFDRVHPILPIIYHRRYFSWADQENPGPVRTCLRSAMRTIAAAMSAPGRRYCDQLYAETFRLLQVHMVKSQNKIVLEYLQAWLLIGHYELLRVSEYQAMLTAGRCFRLVLMARLSDIDSSGHGGVNLQQLPYATEMGKDGAAETFSLIEEQRRVFWGAFCLDRFLCSRNDYPVILQEDMVNVRLPAPELNFQQNKPIRTCFLSEAVSGLQKGPQLSPFAQCVVLATFHGQCMALRRSSSVTTKESHESPIGEVGDFRMRQQRLLSAIDKHVQLLRATSHAQVDSDSMLLFAHMLAQSAVIRLGQASQRSQYTGRPGTAEQQGAAAAYESRSIRAACEMVRLAKQVPSFSASKAHPFLPDSLACAVSFLSSRNGSSTAPGDDRSAQHLLRLLRDMRDINNLARGYMIDEQSTQ